MPPIAECELQQETFTYVPLALSYQPTALNGARVVGREEGRALETLAHAVEYLQDEAALNRARVLTEPDGMQQHNNALEAIDTLKAMSRSLWFSLPVREPLWRKIFHRHSGAPVVTLPMS